MRLALALLLLGPPLCAQLHFGIKGGIPWNDFINTASTHQSKFGRWTLGPMAELDLPAGLGVEVNALYRRTGYADHTGYTSGSWEFPLLLKYKFADGIARPYVAGGLAFRRIGDLPLLTQNGSRGVALGAGIRFHLLLVHVSPELRYTRWNNNVFTPGAPVSSALNQAEFLIGLMF